MFAGEIAPTAVIVCLLSLSVRRVCFLVGLLFVEYGNIILVASTTHAQNKMWKWDETNSGSAKIVGRTSNLDG